MRGEPTEDGRRDDHNRPVTSIARKSKDAWKHLVTGGTRREQAFEVKRRIVVINAFSIIGILNLIVLGALALIQNNVHLWMFDYAAAFSLGLNLFYLRKTGNYKLASYCGIGFIGLLYYYLLFTGGVNNTAHVWYFTFPIIASFILGSREGLIATLALFVPALVFFSVDSIHPAFTTYSLDFKLRFIPSFMVVAAFSYLFENTRENAQRKIEGKNAELKSTVSALRETEEKLRRIGEELEQRVEERTAELYMANLQLASEMEVRERSENALRESEGKLNAMFQSISDDMVMVDRDLNISWANEKAREAFGPMLESRKCYKALCDREEPCEPHPCLVLRAFQDERVHRGETKMINRRGQELYFHCSANVALRDEQDRPSAVLAILRDITDMKKAERALSESEKKYRTLFEDSMEAMSITRGGKIIDVNPAWLKLHGYENRREVLARDVIEFIHPDDRAILTDRRASWPNHEYRSYQIRDVRKDGSIVDTDIYSSRISLGGQDAILTTIRDITEKKQTEREKKALEERLSRSEKMEAIGTLAGGVAHDLNNILGGIVGYPELILMDLPENSPYRKGVLAIKNSGEKAAAIVQDMLTLARRGVAVMEPVNMNDIISDYLRSPEFAKLKSFHPQVKVEDDLEEEILPILGSPVHLSKVVMNLVSNAAEAMPCGGNITVETANRYVDTSIRGYDHVCEGEYIVVRVADTGIGIAQKDISKIFEPFYTKKVMGRSGTGLGMAVVWGTVKDHNGYIDIQSEEGKGTTFTIYFPVNRKAAGKEEKKIYIENYIARGETVAVVDDVAEQREIASAMLRKLGYSITALPSGEEAVEFLKGNTADLVILDMIMDPGIDGLETYQRVKEMRPGQKAIIVSGFAETDRVKEAQRLGAGQYIKKPYTLEKIAVAVRTELDREAQPIRPVPLKGRDSTEKKKAPEPIKLIFSR